MLRIKNKAGKTIMVLKDDANEPVNLEAKVDEEEDETKLKKAKTDKEKAEEEEEGKEEE